jgi:hypothetical protein
MPRLALVVDLGEEDFCGCSLDGEEACLHAPRSSRIAKMPRTADRRFVRRVNKRERFLTVFIRDQPALRQVRRRWGA